MADPNAGRKKLLLELYGYSRPNMPVDFLMSTAADTIKALRDVREKAGAFRELAHLHKEEEEFREALDELGNALTSCEATCTEPRA